VLHGSPVVELNSKTSSTEGTRSRPGTALPRQLSIGNCANACATAHPADRGSPPPRGPAARQFDLQVHAIRGNKDRVMPGGAMAPHACGGQSL
jgi:hypothetical protein